MNAIYSRPNRERSLVSITANMAEIEIGVLNRQCLNYRIYDAATLRSEVAAWQQRRDKRDRSIDWQFTTDDARIKLRQLYPIDIKEDLQIQS